MKHFIQREYLGAWLAKLGQSHPRIVFVDGFAGPGIYEDGEPGSPIVALTTARDHQADLSSCEIVMGFFERCPDRAHSLQRQLEEQHVPEHIKVAVVEGTFEDQFGGEVLAEVEEKGQRLAPSFVMIDPFGWTGFPMSLVERIAAHPRSEVLVTFMYQHMNRFWENPEQAENFDELYGTTAWRGIVNEPTPEAKRDKAIEIYRDRLVEAGFVYTYPFEMRDDGNRVLFYLIHATKHLDGLAAMKDAMWRADPGREFRFSDYEASRSEGQLALFGGGFDPADLERLLVGQFGGAGWVDVNTDVREYVLLRTRYRDGHIRRETLGRMQREGRITEDDVRRPPDRNRAFWGPGTLVRILS